MRQTENEKYAIKKEGRSVLFKNVNVGEDKN